jgi:predicted ester cyclase
MQRSKLFGILTLMILFVVAVVPLAPTAAAQTAVAQRNKDAVRAAIDKLNAGDFDGFWTIYADPYQSNEGDAILHDEAIADNTFFIEALYGAIPDLVINPEVLIAQGDWVATELSFTGTFTEPFTMFGLDPTGEAVYWTEMDFFHFNADGKLDINWAFSDPMAGMVVQLGMMPPMDNGENTTGTPLTSPAGYQQLSADDLAASYASGNTEQSLAQFKANFALGLGADTTNFYTDPFVSWQNGASFEVTAEEALGDAQFLQAINAAMPDIDFSLDVVVAEGDWVAGFATVTGTSTNTLDLGDMGSMPATGQSMAWQIGIIDRYNADGIIVEEIIESDPSPMMNALGLMPPTDEGQ